MQSGNWWELNPQRGRANNSVVLLRHRVDREFFNDLWDEVRLSGSGEPGFYFTNDKIGEQTHVAKLHKTFPIL